MCRFIFIFNFHHKLNLEEMIVSRKVWTVYNEKHFSPSSKAFHAILIRFIHFTYLYIRAFHPHYFLNFVFLKFALSARPRSYCDTNHEFELEVFEFWYLVEKYTHVMCHVANDVWVLITNVLNSNTVVIYHYKSFLQCCVIFHVCNCLIQKITDLLPYDACFCPCLLIFQTYLHNMRNEFICFKNIEQFHCWFL